MAEFPSRISYEQALAIVVDAGRAHRQPAQSLATARADGCVLAGDVVAPVALPAFDNSAMDGFAVRAADAIEGASLRLVGEQFAGSAADVPVGPGECIRVTTGALMPAGADAVLIKEQAIERDGCVQVLAAVEAGRWLRRVGEDVRAGERILDQGQLLTPARIGLAASLGIAQLPVSRRPTVAVLTAGDELIEPGTPLAPGKVYNSNREQLMAQLRALGLSPTAWPAMADDPVQLRRWLLDAAGAFDLVISCGGVSAGEKDYLPRLLEAHGQIHFWKTRLQPGMPVLFGEIGSCLVLALPGNPVSVLATFTVFARPLIDAMEGRLELRTKLRAVLAQPWHKRNPRLQLLRGRVASGDDARLIVYPHAAEASHRLRGAAESNVLIMLPEGERDYAEGDLVEVIPY